jgi:Ca-activated chloride channel homolog
MLPYIAITIVILLVAAAFSVDIAMMHVTRSELRTAIDAAAKAGIGALAREQNQMSAINAAIRVAKENPVAGVGLSLRPEQIVFGVALDNGKGGFNFREGASSGQPINAIHITGERSTRSPDGPVSLMFGSIFGVSSFQPQATAAAARSERDIALVLDVSGSMDQLGRFEALTRALRVFLNELDRSPQAEHVSLTVYSTTARKRVDLTSNLDAIRTAFSTERPSGRTAIGLGLQVGMDSLLSDANTRSFALKTVLLMTDGNHNTGVEPSIIAAQCARSNIQVHTVTFSADADVRRMGEVANLANGIHFHADTNAQLVEQFRLIARQLSVVLIE